jgi:hypothetical protein
MNRLETNPNFEFLYDVKQWVNEKNNNPISDFKFLKSKKISFELSSEQYQTIQNALDPFPNTPVGISQAFKLIPIEMLWRIANYNGVETNNTIISK